MLHEGSETISLEGALAEVTVANAEITLTDDDVVPTALTLTVDTDTSTGGMQNSITEDDGAKTVLVMAILTGETTFALDRVVMFDIGKVTDTATEGTDYQEVGMQSVKIPAGTSRGEMELTLIPTDDSLQEDDETISIDGMLAGVTVTDTAIMLVDDDNGPTALTPWLARFGRTVAEHALDGISNRMDASRITGIEGTFAGHTLSFDSYSSGTETAEGRAAVTGNTTSGHDPLMLSKPGPQVSHMSARGHGTRAQQSQDMTLSEALLGSSFTATGQVDSRGGSIAVWGMMAEARFAGREESLSLDGEVTTAMLGMDYARNNWLAGLALLQSTGEGRYANSNTGLRSCPDVNDEDAVCEGGGRVESSLTAAVPYAGIQVSERLGFWGAMGFGSGDITLRPEEGGSLTSGLTWRMAAAGLRGDLLSPPLAGSGPALALVSDAMWVHTSSENTDELEASRSSVTRARLGLEGSWQVALENGSHLTPRLEIGIRQDGGDAETGSGFEVGGGIEWNDPVAGMTFNLEGPYPDHPYR